MTWNYRVIEYRYLDEDNDHAVHEIFYDDDDTPVGFTDMPIAPYSREEAEMLLKAYDLPPIGYVDKTAIDEDNDDWGWL